MGKFPGTFRSGKNAEDSAGTVGNIPFKLDADSHVICSAWEDKGCEVPLIPQFSPEAAPVSNFLEFLWKKHKKSDPTIVTHSCKFDETSKKWTVTPSKVACLMMDVEIKSTYSFTDKKSVTVMLSQSTSSHPSHPGPLITEL